MPVVHHQDVRRRTGQESCKYLPRQSFQALRSVEIGGDRRQAQPGKVGFLFDRRVPNIGAAVFPTDAPLAQPPERLFVGHGNVKKRLHRAVVIHLLAPEDLAPQAKFPIARRGVAAGQALLGQDLVPGVLRVAEDDRAGWLQPVVAPPQLAFFGLNGQRRQLGHLLCQPAQAGAFRRVDQQVVSGNQEVGRRKSGSI